MAHKVVNNNITVIAISRAETQNLISLLTASLLPRVGNDKIPPILTIKEHGVSIEEFVLLLEQVKT